MFIKKIVIVVMLASAGVLLGGTMASAATDFTHLCLAASSSDAGRVYLGSSFTAPLAATGTGIDVGTWVFAGIAIGIVGLAVTLLPARRTVGMAGPTLPA